MNAVNRHPTGDEGRRLAEFVAEYAPLLGKEPSWLEEAFLGALEDTSLDFESVLSRMKWLLDPSGPRTIALLERKPSLSPSELASHVASPTAVVLDFIVSASVANRDVVEAVYRAIRESSRDPYRLRDLSEERILQEMKWWMLELGFPAYYFETMPPDEIARQILVNRFYELQGTGSASYKSLRISYRSPDGTSIHWVHRGGKHLEVEHELESSFRPGQTAYDVSVYSHAELYLYIVRTSKPAQGDGFASAAPASFSRETAGERQERYEKLYEAVRNGAGIVVDRSKKEETGEHRLMVAFPHRAVPHFMADLSRVLIRAGIDVRRKYTVTFAGARPVIISSFYADGPFPDDLAARIAETGLYPDSRLSGLSDDGTLSTGEIAFAHALVSFVHTFIVRRDPNLAVLESRFGHDPGFREASVALGRRLARETYPRSKIEALLIERPETVRKLYETFSLKFDPSSHADGAGLDRAVAALSAELVTPLSGQEEQEIFACAILFITATLRTNFFLPVKTSLAFRLSPAVLEGADYPEAPHGIFYIRGRDFTAFHVRFAEIARGGIRIVRSGAADEARRNEDTLFEECYNLALTQNRKNKDIPEGGAKGVILPEPGSNDSAGRENAFMKYIDGLLDLMLPENRAHVARFEEELLFLGPDEGTAELMDAASVRSRERGYRYWKAFTTGKSARIGGISHIDYGMTTCGIRRYVLGILGELGVDERTVTKIQTGGPDGDLGGNEILSSNDITLCVVDGAGVLYDPEGLDREELTRLARERRDSSGFDARKLSSRGFLVKVTDRDIALPDGTAVASGLAFRNGFHLSSWMKADLFVPCGGRPASINGTNWQRLLDGSGAPVVRWIVEGANLFITQEARRRLEEKGVIVFKDSSTNKGGVTSSSLEVLSGLALDDAEYERLMCAQEGESGSPFRRRYIEEIRETIRKNADSEFRILWKLRADGGTPLSELSDSLSDRIIGVTGEIAESGLYDDPVLRRNVLALHVPGLLRDEIGLDRLLERIPESYLRAVFARTAAKLFIYEYGTNPGYEAYRRFIERLREGTV